MNKLYYGDCLTIMRDHIPRESVDLIYLDPPFNSNQEYNAIYRDETGRPLPDQIEAFCDLWELDEDRERALQHMPILMREAGVEDAAVEFWRTWIVALRNVQPRLLAEFYTDEGSGYHGIPNRHTVKHNIGQYVDDLASVNGTESFWAMLKRGYYGVYHRMSPAHLQRYVDEFAGRHNMRACDTLVQLTIMCQLMVGKRLRYKDLAVGRKAGQRRVAT